MSDSGEHNNVIKIKSDWVIPVALTFVATVFGDRLMMSWNQYSERADELTKLVVIAQDLRGDVQDLASSIEKIEGNQDKLLRDGADLRGRVEGIERELELRSQVLYKLGSRVSVVEDRVGN